ncbi:MAG: ATP-binding domain-containing protein [Proteobacteria bacterium]|nr:ATP-binding domain-containing protein [Pseudomonadota bacterium]
MDEIIRSRDIRDFPLQALKALPLVTRQFTLHEWIEGKSRFQDGEFPYGAETASLLQRLIGEYIDPERSRIDMVIHYWEELFTNFEFLKERFLDLAGNDFSQTMLDEVVDWLKHNYITRYSPDPVKKRDLVDLISDGKKTADVGITLDYEDDPILLYFYQKIFKDVVRKKGAKLSYSHMMIDEVQDMSPIELSVLMNVLKSPLSLTLAGDVDQKMIEHSGFRDWDSMLSNMGLTGQKVSTLRVGYRSTFEIMEFAQVVLGELASTKDFTATRHGPPVELFQYSNQGEMVHFLSKSIKELLADEPNASVAVIGLSPEDATEYYTMLDKMEIPNLRLVSDQDFLFLPGVDVTDIKQIKGLEFDYVILLDVDRVNYPDHSYSKYLLHIASTRAAHQLWLMNRRDPSPVVPESLTKRAIH